MKTKFGFLQTAIIALANYLVFVLLQLPINNKENRQSFLHLYMYLYCKSKFFLVNVCGTPSTKQLF